MERSKRVVDLALEMETNIVTTHIHQVPVEECEKKEVMRKACRELAEYADSVGAYFAIETGGDKKIVLVCAHGGNVNMLNNFARSVLHEKNDYMVFVYRASAAWPKVQQMLDKGDAFVAQIRKCNDDIPGEEVSGKIDRMEMTVRRIFDRARSNPEIIPDLKKLMDYYLPMTVKLLTAYADMDAQPVQGGNIESAKREIEGTLDTLNRAFEKLLDELFQETALDVSSDITVLQTLLAQEGLTDDELSRLRH